jgi:hypothetical protein
MSDFQQESNRDLNNSTQLTSPRDSEEKGAANPLELYYLTRAYNHREITFDEWLTKTLQWANDILSQKHKKRGAA